MLKSGAVVLVVKLRGWVVVGVDTVKLGCRGWVDIGEIVLLQFMKLLWNEESVHAAGGFELVRVSRIAAAGDANAFIGIGDKVPVPGKDGEAFLRRDGVRGHRVDEWCSGRPSSRAAGARR